MIPDLYVKNQGWDEQIANEYSRTFSIWKKKQEPCFSTPCPGVAQFNSAVATGTSKALAGQMSPQEALDEVADEWKKIIARVGEDKLREAYAVGVALEDNLE